VKVDLDGLVRTVVEGAGLELVEVSFGREQGRRVLSVSVDREGGVDLEAIADVNRRIARRLDLEGFDPGPYSLEVGSPGVERPLRSPAEFARRVGERVKVKTTRPVDGARTLVGTILAADERQLKIATDRDERTIPLEEIASARTVFEWGGVR
jgi:ribosome maturation factor RimP